MQNKRELYREVLLAKRRALSPRQRAASLSRAQKVYWPYPAGVEREYTQYLQGLIREFHKGTLGYIEENLDDWLREKSLFDTFQDDYETEFGGLIASLKKRREELIVNEDAGVKQNIAGYGAKVNTYNAMQWTRIQDLSVGVAFDVDQAWTASVIKDWASVNHELIKTLSDEYITKVNTIISEGVQQGKSYRALIEEVKKLEGKTDKFRPELIAHDQIGKLNGVLTKGRQLDAGIQEYLWSASLDERVRPSHSKMDGSVNKWADGSEYKPRGAEDYRQRPLEMQGAIPGSQIRCRCVAIPAFAGLIEEVDDMITAEEKRQAEETKATPSAANLFKTAVAPKPAPPPPPKAPDVDFREVDPEVVKFKDLEEAEKAISDLGVRSVNFRDYDKDREQIMEKAFAEFDVPREAYRARVKETGEIFHSALTRAKHIADISTIEAVGGDHFGESYLKAEYNKRKPGPNALAYLVRNPRSIKPKQAIFMNNKRTWTEANAKKALSDKIALERSKMTWFSGGEATPAEAIVHHEVGHFIYYNKAGWKTDENDAFQKRWIRQINPVWERHGNAKALATGDPRYKKSEYAREDASEAFAEAWAAYVYPKGRKFLPQRIVDFFKNEVDK